MAIAFFWWPLFNCENLIRELMVEFILGILGMGVIFLFIIKIQNKIAMWTLEKGYFQWPIYSLINAANLSLKWVSNSSRLLPNTARYWSAWEWVIFFPIALYCISGNFLSLLGTIFQAMWSESRVWILFWAKSQNLSTWSVPSGPRQPDSTRYVTDNFLSIGKGSEFFIALNSKPNLDWFLI